jgi:hypothetical protein
MRPAYKKYLNFSSPAGVPKKIARPGWCFYLEKIENRLPELIRQPVLFYNS